MRGSHCVLTYFGGGLHPAKETSIAPRHKPYYYRRFLACLSQTSLSLCADESG